MKAHIYPRIRLTREILDDNDYRALNELTRKLHLRANELGLSGKKIKDLNETDSVETLDKEYWFTYDKLSFIQRIKLLFRR